MTYFPLNCFTSGDNAIGKVGLYVRVTLADLSLSSCVLASLGAVHSLLLTAQTGVGRFGQVDPARDGVNWYEYVRNAPVQKIDPTGRKSGRSKDVCVACTGINPNRLRSVDYTYNPCQDCCTALMAEPALHNIAICAAAAGVPGPIDFPETISSVERW